MGSSPKFITPAILDAGWNYALAHKHFGDCTMIDFLKDLLKIGLRAILKVLIFLWVGTGGGAIVCWYYSIPLGFSIVGCSGQVIL
jgi:hypothetical protein